MAFLVFVWSSLRSPSSSIIWPKPYTCCIPVCDFVLLLYIPSQSRLGRKRQQDIWTDDRYPVLLVVVVVNDDSAEDDVHGEVCLWTLLYKRVALPVVLLLLPVNGDK